MKRGIRLAAAALALAVVGACTDDLGSGGDNAGGDFAISVGSGTQPQYSWPGGPALSVSVFRANNTTIPVWAVVDAVNQNIASPYSHGSTPGTAVVQANDEPTLSAGVRYRVEIRLPDNQSAFQEFTR